ncbi:MAG: class II aldolase/adducin family protein [Candidatus Koribacter versatilis]|uniref:Class II aldolase/adducin family protein n=1 Tax=Candidatus Korobacter versatilis TaxID=658062 RepID=A0A932EPR8_9BACT|nr:class II aldolase/adducin family protein [Candidatus Koribacter versatilis]
MDGGKGAVSEARLKSERQYREEICRFGKMLHERGFVAATDGNLSVRLGDGNILVTPTGMCKSMMEADDMAVVDQNGRQISGRRGVTSEIGMHLLIYQIRPDIHAVVHAHPPTATGFAACGQPLDQPLVSEIVVALGCVPLAKYATPGTPELAEALEPLVGDYDAILMANHGVVAYAEELEKAYMKMETVEHFAKISVVCQTLGTPQLLNDAEVSKLLLARQKYAGVTSTAAMSPQKNGHRNGNSVPTRPLRSFRDAFRESKRLIYSALALFLASARLITHRR